MLIAMSSDVVKHECCAGYPRLLFHCWFWCYCCDLIYVNLIQCYIFARLVMNGVLTVLHGSQQSGVRFPKRSMANLSAGCLYTSSALPCVGCDPQGSRPYLLHSQTEDETCVVKKNPLNSKFGLRLHLSQIKELSSQN